MAEGERQMIAWGVAAAALEGEEESGDLHLVQEFDGGALVAVIDGLGHGPEAAAAARLAAETLEGRAEEPILSLIQRCHERLRGSRGVVMTLASIRASEDVMSWTGVGNIEGTLLRAAPADGQRPRESVMLVGGVPGHQLPSLRATEVPIAAGDTLVLSTDGVSVGYLESLGTAEPPQRLADRVLSDFGKGTDDALVLVARYLGEPE